MVNQIATIVQQRSAAGKNFGTIIVAEGLLEAIPEFRNLISELERIPMPCPVAEVLPQLTSWSRALFESLPEFMRQELLIERQSNAVLQLGQLETERLMAELVEEELKDRQKKGTFKGGFSAVCQFMGYQARCSMPSDFDSDYAYALGGTAALLAAAGHSSYMAVVSDLAKPVEQWSCGGVPYSAMMVVPRMAVSETNRSKPTIEPAAVDLKGNAFLKWCKVRGNCARDELYENPGPIQFCGASASSVCATVASRFSYINELSKLSDNLGAVAQKCRPGCDPRKVRVATQSLATLNSILDELSTPLVAMPEYQFKQNPNKAKATESH